MGVRDFVAEVFWFFLFKKELACLPCFAGGADTEFAGAGGSGVGVDTVTVVSLFAATLSTVSFVPQAWGIIRSRSTEGISLKMYLITVVGFATWLTYGILVRQWAIVVQNVVCLGLSSFILTMKLLPQAKKEAVAEALTPPGLEDDPG